MRIAELLDFLCPQIEVNHSFLSNSAAEFEVRGFSIDSRTINPGEVFIALRGENFDGHDYIDSAVLKGAVAVIAENKPGIIPSKFAADGKSAERFTPEDDGSSFDSMQQSSTVLEFVEKSKNLFVPYILVDNSLRALALLAKQHRAKMTCKVISLTGSNGKTTVKEMIANILPQPSFATFGNLNNHIGVPLCALKLEPEHKYAVFELGANHIGEVAYVVDIVKPDVALINNVAPAHIEGFGSIEGVARAKGEIYQGLVSGGIAVINDDDNYAHYWDGIITKHEVLRFSKSKQADVYAKDIVLNNLGFASFTLNYGTIKEQINLNVPGEHNVSNALAAASCCLAVGIPLETIKKGLESFQGVLGRMTYKKGFNNAVVIDDTYNANLRSTLTAIDVLSARQGIKIFVMGDMVELGEYTNQYHNEVGQSAKNKGIDLVLTLGNHSSIVSKAFGASAKHYTEGEILIKELLPHLNANVTVLVKGSRAAQMEKIVQKLCDKSAENAGACMQMR